MNRVDLSTLRGAWWAGRSLRSVRRRLPAEGVRTRVPAPPRPSAASDRGVLAVLSRQPATCLERALVLQSWLAARGSVHDVVIGVRMTDDGIAAHAWVDEVDLTSPEGYEELHRLQPQ
jgi:hypothetical protein